MSITRMFPSVEILGEGKGPLLQLQTIIFLMNMMIGLNAVIGLAICFCCLLNKNNTRRNGHGNILSEGDECSSSEEDERMIELKKCRTRISELCHYIRTIDGAMLTLQYRFDKFLGEDCGINESIVHRVLAYFGLA